MPKQSVDCYPQATYNTQNGNFEGNALFKTIFSDKYIREEIVLRIKDHSSQEEPISKTVFIGEEEWIVLIFPLVTGEVFNITAFLTTDIEVALSETTRFQSIERNYNAILESIYDDFVIINKDGIIEKVMPNFDAMYGVDGEKAIGVSVHKMEEMKIFNPSVALIVMKTLKQETMLQYTGAGKYLICTAIPIFDENKKLRQVVSYSRDVTKYEKLREEFEKLQEMLNHNNVQLERLKKERGIVENLVNTSPSISKVMATIERVAGVDVTILFMGESGVGKSMLAEIVHELSPRKHSPFICINCGAIPEHLMESELFGYEKGAFTGASKEGKAGLIELADGGTLFLDEIAELPLHMQVKLLGVVQEKKIIRVGSVIEKAVDFRLIAATNKDLPKLVGAGLFREDLYYRLNVMSLQVPSLRERRDDIFPLTNILLKKYNKKYKVEHSISSKVVDILETYNWPGNIRELENVIERMVLIATEFMIDVNCLPQHIVSGIIPGMLNTAGKTLKMIQEEVERQVILEHYRKYKTTTKVAEVLGISQPSASLKIKKYL